MPLIDPQITLGKIIEWEARHETTMKTAESTAWHIVTVGGQRFALVYCFATDTYPTVWGYHVGVGDRLSCRHFYFSASEAAWRAGTGVRCQTSVDVLTCIASLRTQPKPQGDVWKKLASVRPHGWVKSAEYFPGVPSRESRTRHRPSGYIYEGMVSSALHEALEDWYQRNKADDIHQPVWYSPLIKFSDGKDDYVAMERHVRLLVNLVVLEKGKPAKSVSQNCLSELVNCYGAEREYVSVVPAEYLGGGIERADLYKHAPTLQRDFKNTSGARTGIAHKLKRSTPLWDWIMECLYEKQGDGVRRLHPILGIDHIITKYLLKAQGCDIHVEIAETAAPMTLSYRVGGIVESTISTPVCWVRSVYVTSSPITTFGTYKLCPLDLAFLVQKPCDYVDQTAEDLSTLLGVRLELLDDGRKAKKAFSPKQTPLARHNIVKKGGRDVYLSLALFNEMTSPLIKAYKRDKRYVLFRYKYKTMDKVMQGLSDCNEDITRATITGVTQYLALHDFRSGKHGKEGQARAQAFHDHISKPDYDPESLPRDFFELFANNKVNGARDGWSWIHKIQSGPQSLFTVVSQHIIPMFCTYEIDPRIRDLAAKAPLPVGPNNTFQRLMHKAIALGIVVEGCEKQVQDHSAELLQAVQKS